MATGTGLDGQVGYKLETTVGTEVTVDKFVEFDSEGLEFDPSFIEPSGLKVGTKFKRGSRLVQSRNMVSGSIAMQHATRNMGAFWKLALGSSVTTPTNIVGTAYKQIHQCGGLVGKSMTLQVGRPEPSGTVRAHTFRGCKVTGWEFSCSDNDTARLSLDVDGWNEATATALATASFVSSEVFSFAQATTFTLGATVAGTTELTVSGGTAVATVVRGVTLRGENPMNTERFGLGNSGIKKEQLENGDQTITGTLDIEYSKTEWYDPFKAGTAIVLYLKFVGSQIAATGEFNTLEFIIPQAKIKKATPKVDGPDVVQASVEFEVYDGETYNPFQVKLISADSTAI